MTLTDYLAKHSNVVLFGVASVYVALVLSLTVCGLTYQVHPTMDATCVAVSIYGGEIIYLEDGLEKTMQIIGDYHFVNYDEAAGVVQVSHSVPYYSYDGLSYKGVLDLEFPIDCLVSVKVNYP